MPIGQFLRADVFPTVFFQPELPQQPLQLFYHDGSRSFY
jgi:hypothetical protein